eukprot:TRINITY_DN18334_c0_g1_i1.p1 TRINITY_DN18334_c0_g1~~TRINITY_DN18334_c0_g1_i1.p1  ORF type:complete len:693 (+),score=195.99 TRINITY_DN18334_c0_g1_i1:79-2157(+)
MMFSWRNLLQSVSAIDTLLDKGNFEFTELLDEEDLVQECKSRHTKLIEYICRPENMTRVINYFAEPPSPNADNKTLTKYPYVCSEIICSEVSAIADAVCKREDLLTQVFSFLYRPSPAEPGEAAPEPAAAADVQPQLVPLPPSHFVYCSKVAQYLLQRKVAEVLAFLKKKDDFVPQLFKHITQPGTVEFIIKLFQCSEHPDGTGTLEWLCQSNLVMLMVDLFSPTYPEEVHEGAAQALSEIITTSFMSTSLGSPVVRNLLEEDVGARIFSLFLQPIQETGGPRRYTALSNGLPAVSLLLSCVRRPDYDEVSPASALPGIFRAALDAMPKYLELLKHNDDAASMHSSFNGGCVLVPLGAHRLRVVEFILALVQSNYKCVIDYFAQSTVLLEVLDLFFQYCWHTLLHHVVLDIVLFICASPNNDAKLYLLSQGRLQQRILDAEVESASEAESTGLVRGHIGTITKLATAINQLLPPAQAAADPRIIEHIEGVSGWSEYTANTLVPRQKQESQLLGGRRPGTLSAEALEGLLNEGGGVLPQPGDDEDEDENYEDGDGQTYDDPEVHQTGYAFDTGASDGKYPAGFSSSSSSDSDDDSDSDSDSDDFDDEDEDEDEDDEYHEPQEFSIVQWSEQKIKDLDTSNTNTTTPPSNPSQTNNTTQPTNTDTTVPKANPPEANTTEQKPPQSEASAAPVLA